MNQMMELNKYINVHTHTHIYALSIIITTVFSALKTPQRNQHASNEEEQHQHMNKSVCNHRRYVLFVVLFFMPGRQHEEEAVT